ncbi:uncharacterized protein MAM_04286 [Metarhizium album ARSEF 1941]|uniref:RING finger domain protein n=1 Tax=Metarhizium album (strain ARSEF 1941) TaxID=1081103 RepID=A0A0B2WWU4_METAS|nr:uncharacterized protein MAM_04286 [Metarhizium album ARSEF 1941]KHN97897.1 hypothetical protein MAM_04286 [Metarhizium album ARSEF 1941]
MASRGGPDGHLDAGAGREVVFCHACSLEWYRDEQGLICPRCESDITEIVSLENDPRRMGDSSASTSPSLPPLRHADDSDPDEADIEEHLGPQGFRFRQSIRSDPDESHHDPSMDPVLRRFQDMIQSFSQPRRSELISRFSLPDNASRATPRFRHTTFTSRGGTASVTIFSAPAVESRGAGGFGEYGDESTDANNFDPFQTIFSNVIRDLDPPDGPGEGGAQMGLARSLRDILNHFNPANATMGDVVYTQEALDRIVTQLMETTSQSNGAPQASNDAIAKLDRRTVDKDFFGPEGKAECSICIDTMQEGEIATYLPFCRTPIEKNERGQENSRSESVTRAGGAPGPSNAHSRGTSRHNSDQSSGVGHRFGSGSDTPTGRAAADMFSSVNLDAQFRPSNPSEGRLNVARHNVASTRERDNDGRNRENNSEWRFDTSRTQRRTSHSPSSPRPFDFAEQAARSLGDNLARSAGYEGISPEAMEVEATKGRLETNGKSLRR